MALAYADEDTLEAPLRASADAVENALERDLLSDVAEAEADVK